jgi:hypothetical protein
MGESKGDSLSESPLLSLYTSNIAMSFRIRQLADEESQSPFTIYLQNVVISGNRSSEAKNLRLVANVVNFIRLITFLLSDYTNILFLPIHSS